MLTDVDCTLRANAQSQSGIAWVARVCRSPQILGPAATGRAPTRNSALFAILSNRFFIRTQTRTPQILGPAATGRAPTRKSTLFAILSHRFLIRAEANPNTPNSRPGGHRKGPAWLSHGFFAKVWATASPLPDALSICGRFGPKRNFRNQNRTE